MCFRWASIIVLVQLNRRIFEGKVIYAYPQFVEKLAKFF